MKRQTKIGVASWLAVAGLTLVLSCCAGLKAREHVLIPAMEMAWAGITTDIGAGMSALTVDGAAVVREECERMGVALATGDIQGILMVDWARLRGVAEIGISLRLARKEIGPGVYESLKERLRVFSEALKKLGAAR